MTKSRGRREQITGPFTWHLIEMIASPAWKVLSLSARRVLDRIALELHHHGGEDNGRLPVTYEHFEEYGIDRHAIGPAIREAAVLGFIEITEVGTAGNREFRRPSRYRLTHKYAGGKAPTDEWRRISSMEEALARARAARLYKAPQKQKSSGGKRHVSVGETHTETIKPPVGETHTTGLSGETPTTSISRVGSAEALVTRPTRTRKRGSEVRSRSENRSGLRQSSASGDPA